MKKYLSGLMALLIAITLSAGMTACDSENTYDVTTSGDCIVTSATIGTVYRILHTTSSTGADSTYKAAVTGALYPLSIDHIGGRIFNADSLPTGTDAAHIVFSNFKSSGTLSLKSLYTDKDTAFVYTDSIDCSVPRTVTVWATDGLSKRDYRLEINVHREDADTFRWAHMTEGDFTLKGLEGAHTLISHGGIIYIYGVMAGQPTALSATTPGAWGQTPLPAGFDAASVRLAPTGVRYALATEGLVTSTDGLTWTPVATAFRPDALVAAATTEIAAIKNGAIYTSKDNGATWAEAAADEPAMLPLSHIRGTVAPSKTDKRTENILMTGRTATGQTVVWRKDVDLTNTLDLSWYYLPEVAEEALRCPALQEPSLMSYDGATLLTGLTDAATPAPLYISNDNGRTWHTGVPANPAYGLAGAGHISATTDGEGYVWIMDSATGSLWRGRYNRLGWQIRP